MAYVSDSGSNLKKPPKLPIQFRPLVPQSKPLTSPALPVNLTKPPAWADWRRSEAAPQTIAKGVPVTPSAEYVNSQMMMRWRSTTSLDAKQLAAMVPDVSPAVLKQIVAKMTVLYNPNMTGDPQSGEKYVMMRGNNMDAAGIKATLGHELVHAWENVSPWANPVVGAVTMRNNLGLYAKYFGPGATAAERTRRQSGYDVPFTSEWLASQYYAPNGLPQASGGSRAVSLAGFMRPRRTPNRGRW